MEKEIRLYFHLYADGTWAPPVHDYFVALRDSKLGEEATSLSIGIVGKKENRAAALRYINDKFPEIKYTVVAEAEEGWEQLTLATLYEDAKTLPPFWAFYAHTKGSAFNTPINTSWR